MRMVSVKSLVCSLGVIGLCASILIIGEFAEPLIIHDSGDAAYAMAGGGHRHAKPPKKYSRSEESGDTVSESGEKPVASVPEPATIALLGAGLVGAAVCAKMIRRRKIGRAHV